jgi:hypothetical protein
LAKPAREKFLAKLLWQKKFETVYLDTFTIPIPLPAGGSHWVFDFQITLFPEMILSPP